ncbi:TetR/AcrR family transcriptional regulator [Solibacillus sp. FSL K6-1523]|uniref:TetR/AcrR family transcriptional regulator n=1 Tax=Solibacillus sp. FSL K6-1523 TaxID=2921471 RepID=UPI0030FADE4D
MKRISKEPDIRRQELMDIGFELYMKKGMRGFSIKDVVNRADVATGLFYYYFKSKEEFVDEILNNFILKTMEEIGQILTSNERSIMRKMNDALEVFWIFAEKLVAYKDVSSFRTEQHFQLEQKVFLQIQPQIQEVIDEGVRMGIFQTDNSILASEFILHGVSGVAHSEKLELNLDTKKGLVNLVLTILGYDRKEGI